MTPFLTQLVSKCQDAPGLLANFSEDLPIRRHFLLLLLLVLSGSYSLYTSILLFSHPSPLWFPCLIFSHTAFLLGAYSVCVHHDSVFCVCTLFFFTSFFFLFLMHTSCVFFLCIHACTPMCYIIPRHPFGGLYIIWRAIYIWRDTSIWRALSVLRAPSLFLPPSSFLFFPSSKA